MTYFMYRPDTGRIRATYQGPYNEALLNMNSGEELFEHDGSIYMPMTTHCIKDGVLMARVNELPKSYRVTPAANGFLISIPVPVGTLVTWPDFQDTVEDDGLVECEVPFGGEYKFTLDHPHFKVTEVIARVA